MVLVRNELDETMQTSVCLLDYTLLEVVSMVLLHGLLCPRKLIFRSEKEEKNILLLPIWI